MIPFFFDFDDTLFDTSRFKQRQKELFLSLGVSEEKYQETYEAFRTRGYEPLDHAKMLWPTTPKAFTTGLADLWDTAPQFLYQDAVNFCKRLNRDHFEPFVLTQGSEHYQHEKVERSGIEKLFQKIIVCQDEKWRIISEHLEPNQRFVLADNRTDTIIMLARAHPHGYGIVLDREGHEPHGGYPFFYLTSSFNDIKQLPERFPSLF